MGPAGQPGVDGGEARQEPGGQGVSAGAAGGGMSQPVVYHWIKTECGRAKYAELSSRRGMLARLRLGWFVLVAAIRDWRMP
jgi:hypothetical protein